MTTSEISERVLAGGRSFDPESAAWVRELSPGSATFDDACRRLYALLIKIARRETARRSSVSRISGPELEDLAHQAAADALMRITHKIGEFRGDARFTTWAFKFVIFEVSTKLGRHFWRDHRVSLDQDETNHARAAVGDEPPHQAQALELRAALTHAIENVLTEHQRTVFVAVAIDNVPMDALAARLDTNRNAIYKSMFDARRNIRAYLVANDFMGSRTSRGVSNGIATDRR
ncbi:sigma-70 family RNA polymerase sigma factor [Amycolatopsis sp. FDAARGOS 1241]|uniref:sigma-70 family RNA polymerase sigma factor n=1 Tax=Amycolatopsis sp. FDAARGOS 1241 TaxID=2778070 RepID=UPI00194E13E8|nr:sigma-70 family RNA polymerase sigma factor [Amycolatopsis sp. FDAARGOS 1241]QRP47893.1 sigma-70 family RNA polymerase sigma factor [Amycolatopsis sp. FDAARGOS 1241]